MEPSIATDYASIAAVSVAGVLLVLAVLGVVRLRAGRAGGESERPLDHMSDHPSDEPLVRADPAYFLYVLVFSVCVILSVVLFLWAVTVAAAQLFVVVEMAVVIGMLGAGLAFALRERPRG